MSRLPVGVNQLKMSKADDECLHCLKEPVISETLFSFRKHFKMSFLDLFILFFVRESLVLSILWNKLDLIFFYIERVIIKFYK